MNRIIIGLAVACALVSAAIGAGSASAAETTGFTCVEGGSGGQGTKFSDPDCTEPSASGKFGHVEVAPGKSTTGRATKLTNPVLKTIIAGASVTLEATGYECIECSGENIGSVGEMKVFGTGGKIKITGVTVASSPTKCEVVGGTVTTNPLTAETTGTNEGVVKPVTPPTLASFEIKAKTGQTCAIAGPVTVNGDANGTSKGAIGTTNIPASSKTLTIGVNGASLTGQATGEVGEGGVFHPAAVT